MKLQITGIAICITSAMLAGGCTSATSTVLRRFDNDRLCGNSNGAPCLTGEATPFKGIPITVTVPTHVDVTIFEVLYFEPATMKPVPLTSGRHLQVKAEAVHTPKLFSVDPKKVCAGVTNYGINFDNTKNPQYPSKVTYHADDRTIEDINTALGTLLPTIKSLAGLSPDSPDTTPKPAYVECRRAVAWKRFDLNDLCLEEDIKQFVDIHLNNCTGCCANQTVAAPIDSGMESAAPMELIEEYPVSPQ